MIWIVEWLRKDGMLVVSATPGFWPPSVVAAPEETLHTKVKKGKG